MIPRTFKPYGNAPYPCFMLDKGGGLYMNDAARSAAPPLSDEKTMLKMLSAAFQQAQQQGDAAQAVTLPLLTDALTMRTLTLMPMDEGMLAVAVDEKDAPVYAFSSQMREHLTSVFAVLPLLSKRLEDIDLRYAEEIQQNCYSLLRLASNLEDAGRVMKRGIEMHPLDMTALVDSLCFCADSICREQGVPIEWTVPDHPLPVKADARLLSEAILNLLRNSLQYTRDDNHITVRLWEQKGRAFFSLEDRGLGVKPENQGKIFEPYFSVDPYGDSAMRPGLGLGLSVVREVVTEFGGSVNVESRFGEGTTVSLALPVDNGDETVMGSDAAEYLLNRYSPVYVQLCGYCRLPGL